MRQSSRLTILALLASGLSSACSDSSAPTAIPKGSNSLIALSATSLTAVVNHDVTELPSAVVRDAAGQPVPGVTVTFNIERGGGTATGIIDTTDAAGVAKVGSWKVGTVAGVNVLSARLAGQAKILFSAKGLADAPSHFAKFAGDNQRAPAGSETFTRPQVKVTDGYNNPVPGVKVVFAVTGGGEIPSAAALTDSAGLATPGSWVLGQVGAQTLIATADGFEPQIFSATVLVDVYSCSSPPTLSLGIAYTGALSPSSCVTSDGVYYNKFIVALTAPAHVFAVTSPNFETYMEIRGVGLIASSTRDSGKVQQKIKTILPAGSYTLIVSSVRPQVGGAYHLSVTPDSPVTSGCETTFIAPGTITEQVTDGYDCRDDDRYSSDRFQVHLNAGATFTAEAVDHSYSNHYLLLVNARGEVVAVPAASTNYYINTISFVAPADGFYTLYVSSEREDNAEYQLTVK